MWGSFQWLILMALITITASKKPSSSPTIYPSSSFPTSAYPTSSYPTLYPTTSFPTSSSYPTSSFPTSYPTFSNPGSTDESVFCDCDQCCDISTVDYYHNKNFNVETGRQQAVRNEVYNAVAVMSLPSKQQLLCYTLIFPGVGTEYDCSKINAYVAVKGVAFRGQVSSGSSDGTCDVGWDGLFETFDDYSNRDGRLSVGFLVALGKSSSCYILEDKKRTIKSKIESKYLYQVDKLNANSDGSSITLTATISRNRGSDKSCELPTSIQFVMGDCTIIASTLASSTSTQNTFTRKLTQNTILNCALHTEIDSGIAIFDYSVSVAATQGPSCESTSKIFPPDQDVNFKISMAMADIPSEYYELDNVILRVESYSNINCEGLHFAAAKIAVVVKASSSRNDFHPDLEVKVNVAYLDDTILVQNETWCDNYSDGEKICYFKYVSMECLPVTPQTPCSFVYLGFLRFSLGYSYIQHTTSFDQSLYINEPISNTYVFEKCPVVFAQNDLSIQIPVEVLLEGTDMNADVKATIRFKQLNDSFPLTLRIIHIVASIEGSGISRSFDVNDKLELMKFELSPYHRDAHFCRSEGNEDICSSFYLEHQSIYTAGNPDVFHIPNKGYYKCGDINARASDSFSFKPSDWVFNTCTESKGTLKVQITAVLDDCTTSDVARRLSQDLKIVNSERTLKLNFSQSPSFSQRLSSRSILLLAFFSVLASFHN